MTFKQFLKLKIVLHVLHWTTVACIGLCVCFIALLYISGTGWFRDYLDTYLQKQIASNIHGTITWNHLWIQQPFTLVVTGITVATDDSRPVITVESIKARLSILQLLRKHITIARCTANGGYVVYDNDIHPNLVDIFNIKKSTSQREVPFSIQKCFLKNMRVVYHDSLHRIQVHSSGVDVSGRLFSFKQFNANCSIHSGTIRIGDVTFTTDSVFAAIQKKKNSFTIKRFLCRSNNNATAEGSLSIPAKKSGKWAGTFTVNGDSAFVSLLPLTRSGIRSCSGFLMKAAINGTMQHPQMTLNMSVDRLDFRSVIINKIGVQAQHDTTGNAQCKVAVEDSHCNGVVTATAHFSDIMHQPTRVTYRVEGKLHDDDIMRWLKQYVRQGSAVHLSGCAAAVDVVAAGTSLFHLPNSGQGTITCSNIVFSNNSTIPSITIKTGLSGQAFTINALWNNVLAINGTGTIDNKTIEAQAHYAISDATAISAVLLNRTIAGIVTGDVHYSNAQGVGTTELTADGSRIMWAGITADTAHVAAVYTKKTGFWMNTAQAHISGSLGPLLEELHYSGGYKGKVAVIVSDAHGALPYPDITAQIVVDSFAGTKLFVDKLYSKFTMRDKSASLSELHIVRDSLVLNGKASYALDSKKLTAEMYASSGAQGTAWGSIHVRAVPGRDSLDAGAITIDAMPLRIIHTWFPRLTLPAGVCSAEAQISGAYKNPQVVLNGTVQGLSLLHDSVAAMVGFGAKLLNHTTTAACTLTAAGAGAPVLLNAQCAVTPSWRLDTAVMPLSVQFSCRNVRIKPYSDAFYNAVDIDGYVDGNVGLLYTGGKWHYNGSTTISLGSIANPNKKFSIDSISVTAQSSTNTSQISGYSPVIIAMKTGTLRYGRSQFPSLYCSARLIKNLFYVDSSAIQSGTGFVYVQGQIPVVALKKIPMHPDFRLLLTAQGLNLPQINPFIKGIRFMSGTADGSITCSYQQGATIPFGSLAMHDTRIVIENFTPAAGPLNANVRVNGDSLFLDSCWGKWSKGTISAKGFLCLDQHGVGSASIAARGKSMTVTYQNTNVLHVDSVKALLTHDAKHWNLDGNIMLGQSSVYHEFLFDGISVAGKNKSTVTKQGDNFTMNIKADFPDVNSFELEIGKLFGGAATLIQGHLNGSMLLNGPVSGLQYIGSAKITDGTVTYMNNTFNIVDGYIRQPGGKGFNPFLSLTATTGITQAQGNTLKDSITIKLTLSGEVNKLEVHLSSSPVTYSESEILSLLTFGMTSFESSATQDVLKSGASSLLTKSLSGYASRQAQKLLGLEQVQIQGNYLQGGSARGTTAIMLKKRFGSNLSLTYRRNLENNLKQEGILSWNFFRFLYLEGASDVEGNAGIDLKIKVER